MSETRFEFWAWCVVMGIWAASTLLLPILGVLAVVLIAYAGMAWGKAIPE